MKTLKDALGVGTHSAKTTQDGSGVHNIVSTANKTYYIDGTNGNDNNNGLTSGTAFKTWAKAESMIPFRVKHPYVIEIIGDLNEVITLRGRIAEQSAYILVKGNTTTPGNQIVNGVTIQGCLGGVDKAINIKYIQSSSTIGIHGSIGVYVENCNPRASADKGVYVVSSMVKIENCDFGTDVCQDCIVANHSRVVSATNTGNGTRYGLSATSAATIGKYSTQPTGTTANESASTGGVIR